MFCKNCGNELKDGTSFCSECGAKVENLKSELSAAGTVAKDDKSEKKTNVIGCIIAIIIAIVMIWLIITGVNWAFSAVKSLFGEENGNYTGKQDMDRIGANTLLGSAPINIDSISFNVSTYYIEFEFTNKSDEDIAYITFETYFYDRMGGALKTDFGYDSLNLKYTGPLYAGDNDLAGWQYLFDMPSSAAVVYPKNITVTFVDDKEVTFKNDFYAAADDFYGGKLKD